MPMTLLQSLFSKIAPVSYGKDKIIEETRLPLNDNNPNNSIVPSTKANPQSGDVLQSVLREKNQKKIYSWKSFRFIAPQLNHEHLPLCFK